MLHLQEESVQWSLRCQRTVGRHSRTHIRFCRTEVLDYFKNFALVYESIAINAQMHFHHCNFVVLQKFPLGKQEI